MSSDEAPKEWTTEELLNIGKFVAAVVGLKAFKTGMETGNLPKLADKYLVPLGKELIRNPESALMLGLGYLGFKAAGDESDLDHKMISSVGAMMAYKMAVGGGTITGPLGVALLATLGFNWLNVGSISEVIDKIDESLYSEDSRWGNEGIPRPIDVIPAPWPASFAVACPVDGMVFTHNLVKWGALYKYADHYRREHLAPKSEPEPGQGGAR